MSREIERKYLDIDVEKLRDRLTSIGAVSSGRHFESNIVYDDDNGTLKGKGYILRLRTQVWQNKSIHILTLKTPVDNPTYENKYGVKIRNEFEVNLSDSAVMNTILHSLGFIAVAKYEKLRESWSIAVYAHKNKADDREATNLKIDLDILPFCQVAEIEGDLPLINTIAAKLGLDKLKISTKSYHELHQEWLSNKGLRPSLSFEFSESAKKELKALVSQYNS